MAGAGYRIGVKPSGIKFLQQMGATAERERIGAAIDALSANPRPSGCLKLQPPLDDFWRIRIGAFRVLYTINDSALDVIVVDIRNRGDAYR